MKNAEIANIFREIAQILELKGENPFRIRAYERAADSIEGLAADLAIVLKENGLTSISGIGKDLSAKIEEIIKTGTLKFYENLKKEIPSGLIEMLKIPGLGPKTVKNIYENLKIDTVKDLEEAAKKRKLQALEGIKDKTEDNILRGIKLIREGKERTPLYYALEIGKKILEELKPLREVKKIAFAGSLRRKKDTVRDIDILVTSSNSPKVMDRFCNLPLVNDILAKGETKSSVLAAEPNMQVDLRVLQEDSFGSALMYFTGSKQFNIKLRQLAIKNGYKINEYGVFKGKRKLAGKTEEDIFKLMDLEFIPPELREDRGEIEAALKYSLPRIVDLKSIKGDFHVHSTYSDGVLSVTDIAEAVLKLNYDYIAITDHSQSLRIAGGLDKKMVYEKIEEVKKINNKVKGIKILCGTEADILSNGKIDYPNDVLKEFDLVVASIHSGFKQSKQQLTKRIIDACKNKFVHIIGHPTGRLWGAREAYELDLDQILKAAKDYNTALEINCFPQRLDLNDLNSFMAKKAGVKLALGTDAHRLSQLQFMDLGISIARRAWLRENDLLNCLNFNQLMKWLKK